MLYIIYYLCFRIFPIFQIISHDNFLRNIFLNFLYCFLLNILHNITLNISLNIALNIFHSIFHNILHNILHNMLRNVPHNVSRNVPHTSAPITLPMRSWWDKPEETLPHNPSSACPSSPSSPRQGRSRSGGVCTRQACICDMKKIGFSARNYFC